jgi:class 3 adenylate cyclase
LQNEKIVMKEMNDSDVLIFGAHVPNLLIQRCFHSITRQEQKTQQPFIERFRGALLFVDISGFTALSIRLNNCERLKTHINAYFSKILDVVEKYSGDTFKFAGDALYIVWPTSGTVDLTPSVLKALLCSIEINTVCNNYEVNLNDSKRNFQDPSSVTYLNVHVGISVGTMAVVDVGFARRWEMLIVGQPLIDVAIAENLAKSGEILISCDVYELLNNYGALYSESNLSGRFHCEKRSDNCYLISTIPLGTTENDLKFEMIENVGIEFNVGIELDEYIPEGVRRMNQLEFVSGIISEIYSSVPEPKADFEVWRTEDLTLKLWKLFTLNIVKDHVHEAARSTAVHTPSFNRSQHPR